MTTLLLNIVKKQKLELDQRELKNFLYRTQTIALQEGLSNSLIKVILGSRRAGKSTLALQVIKNSKFAYFNFEDESLPEDVDGDAII